MLDEWLGDLRAVGGLRRSTIRSYALTVAAFCRYATDPAYGWAGECETRGTRRRLPGGRSACCDVQRPANVSL